MQITAVIVKEKGGQFELEKDTLQPLNAYRYDPLDSRITTVGWIRPVHNSLSLLRPEEGSGAATQFFDL